MTESRENPLLQYMVRDPEAFANNLARVMEESGKAMAAYLAPREKGELRASEMTDEIAEVMKTIGEVSEYWLSNPQRAVDAQARLWTGYMDLWQSNLRRLVGEPAKPAALPDPKDKRFKDPEWSDNQFFDFIKQVYLITTRWADDLVHEADGLDAHTKHKAEFYMKQIANAVSPSNFLLTNPELLRETLTSNGENLARGMKMLAEDLKAGNGELRIRQTDASKFKVGENLAVTPGKVIAQNDVCQVIQYSPSTETVYRAPILIVPPWINKFYILDLTAEKSLIRWLVEQGHTVFMVSWVNPDERHASKGFEQYMLEGIVNSIDVVEKATAGAPINIVGYCVGGTLLSATLAWLAEKGDTRIASATFLTTQIDFTHAGDLMVFIDDEQLSALEKKMKVKGYLDSSKMAQSFNLLRSNDLLWPYVVNNYLKGKAPFPFDLLFWNSDSTRMPAANHAFYLRHCYLQNDLASGRMELAGVRLDLSKVKIPVYDIAAREDHIAPAKSVFIGAKLFGGPVTYVMSGSGHIAGVINPPSLKKYQYWLNGPPEGKFEDWVASATEHPGSWWPHWHEWLVNLDPEMVPAREPGGGVLQPIENAPGSFVTAP
ncbi:class I poly(R)-hydroxyalkanoic acid synthase [Segnochrobactraceae bacterium EtOH-i3]